MKKTGFTFWLVMVMGLVFCNSSALPCGFEEYRTIKYSKEMVKAMNAAFKARKELGLEKGDENLLALTNAGYGTINGNSTEPFLDILSNVTACTLGTRSLLPVHGSVMDPLWCALYRKDTGDVVFMKWTGEQFDQKKYNVAPEKILHLDAWKKEADAFIGKYLFSVVSICNSWAANAAWPLLKSAEFHNHICPGLNAGYIATEYLKAKHPLRKGEKYVFIGSPTNCPVDSLQILYDATAGKALTFSNSMDKENVVKYSGDLWFKGCPIPPLLTIAMRVNKSSNSCEGVVLGMDWEQLLKDTGLPSEEFSPKGGKSNPMYFISRTRLSLKMAAMPMSDKLTYIKELKSFFGQSSVVHMLSKGGADPYAVIWDM